MRGHLITGLLAVMTACLVGGAWLHRHPSPRMVRVDLGSLFEEQKKSLAEQIQPGMSDAAQQALLKSAANYASRVDAALSTLAAECRCAVVNSAALLRVPDGDAPGLSDMTERVRALVAAQ